MPTREAEISVLEFRPLTPDCWVDFEKLFGQHGACGGCWCMWWRLSQSEFMRQRGEANKEALKGIVDSGFVPGIIAYANGKPVYGGTSEWLTVNTSNGVVRVQGTYEERTCKILDKLKENGSISNWEYTKDRYEYIGEDGKLHYYLLDFKIFCGDHFYYVETKGYVKLKDKLKWGAMRSKGVDLDIWFDNELKEYENNLNMVTLV